MSGLKDLVYEEDYKRIFDANPDVFDNEPKGEAMRAERELLATVRERFKQMPHVILPENQEIFDFCEAQLDRLAMLKQGRIRSIISYVNYGARIDIEFENGKFGGDTLSLLQAVTERAISIKMVVIEEGWIRISFYLPYFETVGDKSAVISEELDENPEAVALQDVAYIEERDAVLSRPELYEVIKKLADEKGMTPEEWYDTMDAMTSQNLDILRSFMDNSLKKRRDQMRRECEPEDSLL